jgi:dipeptidyl aminopeptidase/acylaminoacyl peptidase
MLAMRRISDPQVSPDGRHAVFNVRDTDLAANRGRTDLWLVELASGELRQLTDDEAADSNARWMPDGGSIVFLSTRSGSSQVWRLPLENGEPKQVTDLPLEVSNLCVFPDGARLAFSLEVFPDAETLAETVEREAAAGSARIYDELLLRHWDSLEDGKRSHVFVWAIGSAQAPLDLMPGIDADCPSRPFGGAEEIAISPDGSELVLAFKDVGREAAWSTDVDLWSVPSDGSSPPRCLTEENPALDGHPVFAPGGRAIAYLAMQRPGYEADRQRIVLLDRLSGEARVLTEDWDRSAEEIVFSPDGQTIYTSCYDLGNHSIFAVEVRSGAARKLQGSGHNASPCPAGERILFAQDSLSSPVELYTMRADGSDARPLTRMNEALLANARMGAYEQFSFRGAGGDTVYGYVVKPADFQPGRKTPVAFLIHGGPQGSFGNHFHYRWNPQAYAGAGFAAVFIDFHGSTGYGQAFTDSIRDDWGGKPYEDLMLGLDHALESYPFLDGNRVAALGASYGGYMINWIAGQTDRFKCLVNHDGIFDVRSMYFETEELWFPEWEHMGTPWEHPEHFARHNPLEHVGKWRTPMLVVHGALDYRVPETQGFASFTALQRRGISSRLLYFPDENHWVLKPSNSIVWHENVLGWLKQWLMPST